MQIIGLVSGPLNQKLLGQANSLGFNIPTWGLQCKFKFENHCSIFNSRHSLGVDLTTTLPYDYQIPGQKYF